MKYYEKAKDYATKLHENVNHSYDGEPYSFHLRMVDDEYRKYRNLIPSIYRDRAGVVVWLHDTIEDCRITYNDLKKEFCDYTAEIVYLLTTDKGRTRDARNSDRYYQGISKNLIAIFVKLCDRIANTKYSKNKGSSMFLKYKKEFPEFIKKIGWVPILSPMIDDLCALYDINPFHLEKWIYAQSQDFETFTKTLV